MKKKSFSISERLRFHERRVYTPHEFSCEASSGKVAYSDGFVAGFNHNKDKANRFYWKAKSKSGIYSIGYNRGLLARKKFKR